MRKVSASQTAQAYRALITGEISRHFTPSATRFQSALVDSADAGLLHSSESPLYVNNPDLRWTSATEVLEKAVTLPSAWYFSQQVAALERKHIFGNTWQVVGRTDQLDQEGAYFTGCVAGVSYIVCRAPGGEVKAYHNVCRHHAAAVASGSGCTAQFRCPYHGWTYSLDGRLVKAIGLKGIQDFKARDYGLVPMRAATWGHFVFVQPCLPSSREKVESLEEHLGAAGPELRAAGMADEDLVHVASRSYHLNCNWKVFCDNFLDGGYHVSVAHPALAESLDIKSYSHRIHERVSVQSARTQPSSQDRLGGATVNYAFVYPNMMINRYGSWMDTNLVVPLSAGQCRVDFDWWAHPSLAQDQRAVELGIESSDQVQREDVQLCEAVQQGLQSSAYTSGRYAPCEAPMFHFHRWLHARIVQAS
ncbi:hypothetical protein WJX73_001477 [Symbiochloris irregularis]|uniref:Choline monooxygenase, chloroplastic n=1 Tax=Symbiochloris irregularis TaxID=706552 RepID=A0AAW1PA36_9CHLO